MTTLVVTRRYKDASCIRPFPSGVLLSMGPVQAGRCSCNSSCPTPKRPSKNTRRMPLGGKTERDIGSLGTLEAHGPGQVVSRFVWQLVDSIHHEEVMASIRVSWGGHKFPPHAAANIPSCWRQSPSSWATAAGEADNQNPFGVGYSMLFSGVVAACSYSATWHTRH